jgi:hypothetical protein
MIVPFVHRSQLPVQYETTNLFQLVPGTVLVERMNGELLIGTQLWYHSKKDCTVSNGNPLDGSVYWKLVPHVQVEFDQQDRPIQVTVAGKCLPDFRLFIKL